MPKRQDIKKVLVIGSGPIIIGQAAEFDYAGTQACKALKEEGLEVVLVNSNPATIMTDANMADKIYIEPLQWQTVAQIIEKERPDGLLPTLGGQTGLNIAVELAEKGILQQYGVALLGTPLEAIKRAEDRELFRALMLEIGEPIPPSTIVETVDAALAFAEEIGYPVIVRPAYTLGGSGGGIAHNARELAQIADKGLKYSAIGQILLEKSVAGWKEIEYEVMRDSADNCITICNMENIDPVGIHTGDSIVIAPSQTLSDREYQMLRTAALKIIRALKIEGGCNVQFALNPHSFEYIVIEVNPRVSRSSALASKATGYPIAKMAAKIAIGLTLAELTNPVTGKTSACFEPALDYCVVKIPRWPFDKFPTADRRLGTQMKATGEVMAIERSFEAALQKAIRSLEIGLDSLQLPKLGALSDMAIEHRLQEADDERLFVVAEAFRRHFTVKEVYQLTKIDPWFLEKIRGLVELERQIKKTPWGQVTSEFLQLVKSKGFSDRALARWWGVEEREVRDRRAEWSIRPVYKLVDTCAAEFEAATPYYYSSYEQEDEVEVSTRPKVVVLGSGPIRIGQGIEFDYCSVHSVWGLQELGYETIIINNNPETVSTDFDTADKLYFEPLTVEDVLHVIEKEQPLGVIVQFGGQTAINLAAKLEAAGVKILGTSVQSIDLAEDREKFAALLAKLGIPQTEGKAVFSVTEGVEWARQLGYPLVVRPSYVLGGRNMEIVQKEEELVHYLTTAVEITPEHPVLIDRYLLGREVEVDAIGDGKDIFIPGIMAHVERAGVHSGDSMAVYPAQGLSREEEELLVDYTLRIGRALQVCGLINIQYVISNGQVYVLEVNPRASRTVPVLSKVTAVPMVAVATKAMLGESLTKQGYYHGLKPPSPWITVKAPVFSFEKLGGVEISLGPEMKSTGEVMGTAAEYPAALLKAMQAANIKLPAGGTVFWSVADWDKEEAARLAARFAAYGFQLAAAGDTWRYFAERGLQVTELEEDLTAIRTGRIQLVINTPTQGKNPGRRGFQLRRTAAEYKIPCLTSLDTANAVLQVLEYLAAGGTAEPLELAVYTG